MNRRTFIKSTALAATGVAVGVKAHSEHVEALGYRRSATPLIVDTPGGGRAVRFQPSSGWSIHVSDDIYTGELDNKEVDCITNLFKAILKADRVQSGSPIAMGYIPSVYRSKTDPAPGFGYLGYKPKADEFNWRNKLINAASGDINSEKIVSSFLSKWPERGYVSRAH